MKGKVCKVHLAGIASLQPCNKKTCRRIKGSLFDQMGAGKFGENTSYLETEFSNYLSGGGIIELSKNKV